MQIASLNSGSNGNCYYVGNEEDAVLVDVGGTAVLVRVAVGVVQIRPKV